MLLKKAVVALGFLILSFQVMASGTVSVNGKDIKTREQLQGLLATQLHFPHPIKNMDTVYDFLSTDLSGDSIIKIKYLNLLKAKLGSEYVETLVQSIVAASEDSPRIILVVE